MSDAAKYRLQLKVYESLTEAKDAEATKMAIEAFETTWRDNIPDIDKRCPIILRCVRFMVYAMLESRDPSVQTEGVKSLRYMTANVKGAVPSVAIDGVFHAMKICPNDARVRLMGFRVIQEMIQFTQSAERLVNDVDGVKRIIKCLQEHRLEIELQNVGTSILIFLHSRNYVKYNNTSLPADTISPKQLNWIESILGTIRNPMSCCWQHECEGMGKTLDDE
jgi:hypothetical protein